MTSCYIHKGTTTKRYCSRCSKGICRECTFEEVVSSRVRRYTSIDREVELEYEFFCPNCFIGYAKGKGYDLSSRGVFFRFKKSPNLVVLIIMWSFLVIGAIINLFFPIGYVLTVIAIGAMIFLKVIAAKNYNKYLKALRLSGKLEPKGKAMPKAEKDITCQVCGIANPKGSVYCNKCGNQLNVKTI